MISIGNIAAGGRAKTPLTAFVASRLRDMGERVAILSRGYARRNAEDGVVVVRDAHGIRADLDRSGDEPLMLARQLTGVAVLASSSRYLAGRLAEHHLDCTVHVLDDGFQHFQLHRDADIVVVGREDLERPRTLPSGHLREPLDAAGAAEAVIALDDANRAAIGVLARDGRAVWQARRLQQAARSVETGETMAPAIGPIVAVAGIAEPSRFFSALRAAQWTIARELPFRDHHRFSRADVDVIAETVRASNARAVITTEKDVVRLLPFRPFPVPVAYVPLAVEVDSAATFEGWLRARLDAARQR